MSVVPLCSSSPENVAQVRQTSVFIFLHLSVSFWEGESPVNSVPKRERVEKDGLCFDRPCPAWPLIYDVAKAKRCQKQSGKTIKYGQASINQFARRSAVSGLVLRRPRRRRRRRGRRRRKQQKHVVDQNSRWRRWSWKSLVLKLWAFAVVEVHWSLIVCAFAIVQSKVRLERNSSDDRWPEKLLQNVRNLHSNGTIPGFECFSVD